MFHFWKSALFCLLFSLISYAQTKVEASEEQNAPEEVYEKLEVRRRSDRLVGVADAASDGATGHEALAQRPILRPGELLETVPGLIVTQHSGPGKANQYFVRGFNLDHGTDFSVSLDHMQVNMPSHGHGQGYADINFVIPELVDRVHFHKGPYHADLGDFSSAGAAEIRYANQLLNDEVSLSGGNNGHRRLLWAQSREMAGNHQLLSAIEWGYHDGPWVRKDEAEKFNGVLRLSKGDAAQGYSVTLMGYDSEWLSTDQIPQRAIASGQLDRLGLIDPDLGGASSRFSLSAQHHTSTNFSRSEWYGHITAYDLALYSNFTYLLENPEQGDEFTQLDDRLIGGLGHKRFWDVAWRQRQVALESGFDLRHDRIDNGLYGSASRARRNTVREDDIHQYSAGFYVNARVRWSDRLRTVTGVRGDAIRAQVRSDLEANSDTVDDVLVSPKFSAIFEIAPSTELFINTGFGFHSNDARGMTIRRDPSTGEDVARARPLSRSRGFDVGISTAAMTGLQSSLTGFWLRQDSELVFVGDGGGTEAGRPSRRLGLEWANHWQSGAWSVDVDVTLSRARFTDEDAAGDYIPGAVERTLMGGIQYAGEGRLSGSLRLRHFGGVSLIEDNSVRGEATTLVSSMVNYLFSDRLRFSLEMFNLFDEEDRDIQYFYASRLAGESPEGVEDIHYHPVENRSFRLALQWRY